MTNSLPTKRNENLLFHTFDETLKPQIEELLSLGKSAGADLVEVFLEKSDNISLLAEQDDISNVSPSFGIGAGIRATVLWSLLILSGEQTMNGSPLAARLLTTPRDLDPPEVAGHSQSVF